MADIAVVEDGNLDFGRGEVDPRYTSAVVLGVVAGSWVGAYLNRYARGVVVKRVFAVLLFCVAIEMFGRAFDLL